MLNLQCAIEDMDAYAPVEAIRRRITAESIVQGVRLSADQFMAECVALCSALMRKDMVRVLIDDEAMPLAA